MSKSRAFANQEKQAQAQRMSRLSRTLVMALATVLSFSTLALVAADQLYRPDTFVIDQLKIKGKLRHLQPSDVEKLVIRNGVGNFFSVELDRIKSEVEGLAWVQRAEVRREWPNTLLIEVSEHRPVMRWNNSKWVNTIGDVVDLTGDISVPNSISLTGQDKDSKMMLRQAYVWKKRLAPIGLELRALELSGSHAWTLGLSQIDGDAEFDLLLGREDIDHRLNRFQHLFEKQFRHADQRLQRVDARYPDGLAIQSELIENNESLAMRDGANPVSN